MAIRVGQRADDSGQSLVEYALILALASIGVMLALLVLQESLGTAFQHAGSSIDAVGSPGGTRHDPGAVARP